VTISVTRVGSEKKLTFTMLRQKIKIRTVKGFARTPDGQWDCWLDKDLKIAFHENGALVGQKRDFTQDGVVVQGTYGFLPHWLAGVRYDVTGLTNKLDGPAGNIWDKNKSDRWTFALTRQIDHFSLLRLQASHANLWVEGAKENVNQVFVQYQHSLGAHGAHSF